MSKNMSAMKDAVGEPRGDTGLSMVIHALNEAATLADTVTSLLPIARTNLREFEIIIVNDGSTDDTGKIADALAAAHPEVRVIHHPTPRGMGDNLHEGALAARMPYITSFPGDHNMEMASFQDMFRAVGQCQVLVGERANQWAMRPWHRALLSHIYLSLASLVHLHRIIDLHGTILVPTAALRKCDLRGTGYSFNTVALVAVMKQGCTCATFPVRMRPEPVGGSSKALKWRTLKKLLLTNWRLIRPANHE